MTKKRVLVFDIETAPMEAYIWHRKEQNIALSQIKKDWFVLSWSAKWFKEPATKLLYRDQQHVRPINNDKGILKPMRDLLDEADIVITQNGRRFDAPKLTARFILNGMKPPSPYKHFDTLQLAQRVAAFTSSSLEYMADKLCTKYKKLKHRNFPGMALWSECLAGNPKAWKEMRRYNPHDTLATEELVTKLSPWAPASFPEFYEVEKGGTTCGRCGARGRMQRRGINVTQRGSYPRFQCLACGSWSQGKKI